jgi:intein/homing endonuclease
MRCIDESSQILMANGTSKRICEVRIGDQVLSSFNTAQVTNTWTGREADLIEITAGDSTLLTTRDHPIKTATGFKVAGEIRVNDEVRIMQGVTVVTKVEVVTKGYRVYNLSLFEADSFCANGILVGTNEVMCMMSR